MKRLILASAIVLSSGLLCLFVVWPSVITLRSELQSPWDKTIPDMEIRRTVAGIGSADVLNVELLISVNGRTPGHAKTVTDRATVKLLLEGLQEALWPDDAATDRVGLVFVTLRNGKVLGPFNFTCRREVDAFSPKFVAGLRAAGIRVPWEHERP